MPGAGVTVEELCTTTVAARRRGPIPAGARPVGYIERATPRHAPRRPTAPAARDLIALRFAVAGVAVPVTHMWRLADAIWGVLRHGARADGTRPRILPLPHARRPARIGEVVVWWPQADGAPAQGWRAADCGAVVVSGLDRPVPMRLMAVTTAGEADGGGSGGALEPLLGPARVWISATPTRSDRPVDLDRWIAAEALPVVRVTRITEHARAFGRAPHWTSSVPLRPGGEPEQRRPDAAGWVLELDHMVTGPVVLGEESDLGRGFGIFLPTDPPPGAAVDDTPASDASPTPPDEVAREPVRHLAQAPRPSTAAPASEGQRALAAPRAHHPLMDDNWIVFAQAAGPRLPPQRALDLAGALRRALMAHGDDPLPEILTGHVSGRDNGPRPSEHPHAAFVPLPTHGQHHNALLGIAVVLPRAARSDEREPVLRAIRRWRAAGAKLRLAQLRPVSFTAVDELDPRATLQASTWCCAGSTWASITPVALDRTPKHLFKGSSEQREASRMMAREVVAQACVNAGLPAPACVTVLADSALPGVPARSAFPPYRGGDHAKLPVHVSLEFVEPLWGPVIIGAGRYLGQGLCAPVPDESCGAP